MSLQHLYDSLYLARRLSGFSALGILPSQRMCTVALMRLRRDVDGDAELSERLAPTLALLKSMAVPDNRLPDQHAARLSRQIVDEIFCEVKIAMRPTTEVAADDEVHSNTPSP